MSNLLIKFLFGKGMVKYALKCNHMTGQHKSRQSPVRYEPIHSRVMHTYVLCAPVAAHRQCESRATRVHIVAVGICQFSQEKYVVSASMSANKDYKSAKSIYDFTANSIKGEEVPLSKYQGHVCLIVNVASKCGLTATNYKELNELYDEYAESKGLRILAFPCNQFNGQEPGGSEDICSFADRQKVKFDLFEKINVNGDDTHPLWKYLKMVQGGTFGNFIKWNFTKFIVDKDGRVVERHSPTVNPSDLKKNLEKYF